MTPDCVRPTKSSVIQNLYHNVGLKCFFIYLKVYLLLSVEYAYFIYILQGSVITHLRCDDTYDNHIIANCPQSVIVKEL